MTGPATAASLTRLAALADYLPWALGGALLAAIVGGTVLAALALRRERRGRPASTRQAPQVRALHVIEGPVQHDGDWLRLIELADGRRRVERLGPQGWEPADQRPRGRVLGV